MRLIGHSFRWFKLALCFGLLAGGDTAAYAIDISPESRALRFSESASETETESAVERIATLRNQRLADVQDGKFGAALIEPLEEVTDGPITDDTSVSPPPTGPRLRGQRRMFARTRPGQAGQPDLHDPAAGRMALRKLRQRRQSPHGPTAHMWRGDTEQLLGGVPRETGKARGGENNLPMGRFSYDGLGVPSGVSDDSIEDQPRPTPPRRFFGISSGLPRPSGVSGSRYPTVSVSPRRFVGARPSTGQFFTGDVALDAV